MPRVDKSSFCQKLRNNMINNGKDKAVTGFWLAYVSKSNSDAALTELEENHNIKLSFNIRKMVLQLFAGSDNTIDTHGATISVTPSIKHLNKVSLDIVESSMGIVKQDVYKYLRSVMPTLDNNGTGEGYYRFDIYSSFYNSWINMYDSLEIFHFIDPIKKANGPYWRYYMENLKLDGSSGAVNGQTTFDYTSIGIDSSDLNLIYDKITVDFCNGDDITKMFSIDFKSQINKVNKF